MNAELRHLENKAQRMENRLKDYKKAIESLGFKRVKQKRKQNDNKVKHEDNKIISA